MAITAEYQAYLKSDKWKTKRRQVLDRAHYKCERCGRPGSPLQVHHKTYKRIFDEKLSDLMAVCARCHQELHDIDSRVSLFGRIGRVLARVIG